MPDGTDLTVTPEAYGGNLQTPYGSAGSLSSLVTQGGEGGRYYSGANNPGAALPDWLSSQFSQRSYNTGGDSGQDYNAWGFGQNNGTFTDANGNPVVQIGDPNKLLNEPGRTGEWLRDPDGKLSGAELAKQVVKWDPTIGYYVDPKYMGSKSTSDRGMEAFGATIATLGVGDALGFLGTAGLDTSALPAVTAPTLPNLAATPEILAPGAAATGSGLLSAGIDTAALPAVTAPALPELAATPDILAPTATTGLDLSTLPEVTAPELGPLADLPTFADPAATPFSAAPGFAGPETPNTLIDGVDYGPGSTVEGPTDVYDSTPGFLQNTFDAIKGNPFAAAGLGLSAVSQVMANKRAKDAASQLRQAAAPISDEAKGLLEQYGKGQLNPADEFRINQWEQAQIAKAQSLYGGNGTASANAVAQIQAQAEAMRSTALEGLLKAGIQASGMALGPLTQAIEAESKDDAAFSAASANALRALMLLGTGSSGQPGNTAPPAGGVAGP